jgi:hypothetical protein
MESASICEEETVGIAKTSLVFLELGNVAILPRDLGIEEAGEIGVSFNR